MNSFCRRAGILRIMAAFFCAGLCALTALLAANGPVWAVHPGNRNLYNRMGRLAAGGTVYDAAGTVLAETKDHARTFNPDAAVRKATAHTVGDLGGFVAASIHGAFRARLVGYDFLNGTFDETGAGNDFHLTIHAELSRKALSAMGNRKGAVCVMNYKTGEILTMVSTPTFDPVSPPDPKATETDRLKGVYVNRVLMGQFAPGSVFKLVTAAAALETLDDPFSVKFSCNYGVKIGGETLKCMGRHGTVDLKKALNYSCNAYFAQLALKLGQDTLKKYAEKFGFNGTYRLDGLTLSAGKYPINNERDIDFGWSAIGQHNDTVNPLHYLTFVASVANGGVAPGPRMIAEIRSPLGKSLSVDRAEPKRMLSSAAADTLKNLMRSNVKNNYGESRFKGLNLCAKSGTAEIDEKTVPHSWFVGFMDDPEHPFAFAVVVENGGAGIGAAATVAKTVLTEAKERY